MTATSSGGWVLAIVRALQCYRIDTDEMLRLADINLEQAYDPNARFEEVKITRLFRSAVEQTQDPGFGLRVAKMMRPTSCHALGFSMWASNNLYEAMERVTKYIKIFTTCAHTGLEQSDDRVRFWVSAYPAYKPVLCHAQYEAYLATVVLLLRYLYPGSLRPLRVGLRRQEEPGNLAPFVDLFRCEIELGQEQAWFEIDKDTAFQRLPTANPELAHINDQLCAQYIARFDKSDMLSRVYYLIMETLEPGEPSMDEISAALNVSTRSLQRKLKENGTTFKSMLDKVRKELALQYIQQSHMPLGEVSYRLGFSHVSNFSRAFKRWMGLSPAEWRDSHQGENASDSLGSLTGHDDKPDGLAELGAVNQ